MYRQMLPRCFKLHLGGFIVEGFAYVAISLLLWWVYDFFFFFCKPKEEAVLERHGMYSSEADSRPAAGF